MLRDDGHAWLAGCVPASVHPQEALLTVLSHLELDDGYDGYDGVYGSYGNYDYGAVAYGAAAYGSFPHGATHSNTVPRDSSAEAAGAGGNGAAAGSTKDPASRSVRMLEGNWREWWVSAGLVGYIPYGVYLKHGHGRVTVWHCTAIAFN